jgi:hypothetical protein
MFRTTILSALLCAAALPALAEPFTIVALGDAPYGEPAEVYPLYETLITTINDRKPQLVIHIGDIKSGSTPCSDELLTAQLGFMNSFAAPVLYTPGDNEWTDCHRKKAGAFDPLDRLAFLRKTFFAAPTTLGTVKLDVTSQAEAGYPENARMMLNDVMFVTAHVPGSNNNFEVRDAAAVQEYFARDAANVTWLKDSFAAAKDAKALVIAIQADMFEFDWNEFGDESFLRHSGYLNFGETLMAEAAAFGKPVLLVYGDSHTFRAMRPFPTKAPNVLALEVPGEANMHAVEITIDPATSGVFSTSIVMNPALAKKE